MVGVAVLAAMAVAPSNDACAAPDGVRLISAAPSAIRFMVDVPETRLTPLPTASHGVELSLAGYDVAGRPGDPALPERVVSVAVPPRGAVRLSANVSATELRDAVVLAGIARVERGEKPPPSSTPDASALSPVSPSPRGQASPPQPPARLIGVSWMRNQRVARIAVHPATYDPVSQRLTIHHRIEVEIAVEHGAEVSAPAEANDPFEGVYRATLVNYEQGRSWRRPRHDATVDLASGERSARPAAIAVPDTSVYANRRWVKIAIPQTGFYRVDFGQVRNTALFAHPAGGSDTTIALDSLRLFTWPGVPILPESTYCDSCGMREVAIGFVENGNGMFSNNRDYFYFFALGPSDWADLYDASQPETTFIQHPYETRNYYYLAVATPSSPMPGAPLRVASESAAVGDTSGTTTPATFRSRLHGEVENEYWPDATSIVGYGPGGSYLRSTLFWEKWYWTSVNRGQTFSEPVAALGIDPAQPARMRVRTWGLSFLEVGRSKSSGVFDHYADVRLGPVTFPRRGWDGLAPVTFDTTFTGLAENGDQLEVGVADNPDPPFASRRVDRVGMAWFDLFYERRFEPVGNELAFDSPPGGGHFLYRIGPFSVGPDSLPRVFDVTDPLAPIEILNLDYRAIGPGAWQMRFQRLEGDRRRYRVVPDWKIVRPPNSDVVDAAYYPTLANLRDPARGADCLVIYYDGFKDAADALLRWRREHLPLAGSAAPYDTASVPISALYDQFSGGRTDPSAIRNFLRAAFFNWGKPPRFVTFLGDASYDFRNLKGLAAPGLPGTLVPSYEGGYDLSVDRQYATDDWLLNVDDPNVIVPDFFGGRIPVGDASSALAYVLKLLQYEGTSPFGEWRNRVMLIADDNEQGSDPDPLQWDHMVYTAELDREGLPAHVDRGYVYLHRYPDGPNDTKPAAKADIMEEINRGVLMFNYIGHGSPFKISDESVLIDSDADLLGNGTRPSVFVAASCDVGKYNDPGVLSLGERLIVNPSGGCVGVISATELAFSNVNAALNRILFQQLFQREGTSGQYFLTLIEGLLVAKTGGTNNQKYQLMGDAALRLNLPRRAVEVALEDADGNPVAGPARGQTLTVKGQVLDRPGGSPVSLNGTAALLIEDSAPIDTLDACFQDGSGNVVCETYPFRAAPMFRGDVAVTGGQFEARFVAPMDSRIGPRGRVRAYVEATDGYGPDGAGSLAVPVSIGTAPTGDREGPRITLSFPGGSTSVRSDATLRVDLYDPSGILITGYSPQNGIIVTVDGSSSQREEISSSFRYAANSYQSGTAYYPLPGLAPGAHEIRVSAADNLAVGIGAAEHRNSATIAFEVSDNPALRITRAMLFPNPAASRGLRPGGQFVMDAPGDSVNVLLRLYTVSGRLVRKLEARGGLGQVQIPWDGLDDEGAPLANGTYLFSVHANPREAGGLSSGRQRAHAEGRFVIVNP